MQNNGRSTIHRQLQHGVFGCRRVAIDCLSLTSALLAGGMMHCNALRN